MNQTVELPQWEEGLRLPSNAAELALLSHVNQGNPLPFETFLDMRRNEDIERLGIVGHAREIVAKMAHPAVSPDGYWATPTEARLAQTIADLLAEMDNSAES